MFFPGHSQTRQTGNHGTREEVLCGLVVIFFFVLSFSVQGDRLVIPASLWQVVCCFFFFVFFFVLSFAMQGDRLVIPASLW